MCSRVDGLTRATRPRVTGCFGHPPVAARTVSEIEALATSTNLSIRQIHKEIAGKVSRGVVGEITKRVRAAPSPAF